jgi:hypothetical protein
MKRKQATDLVRAKAAQRFLSVFATTKSVNCRAAVA